MPEDRVLTQTLEHRLHIGAHAPPDPASARAMYKRRPDPLSLSQSRTDG